jgi:WD40 repeat protein
LLRRIARFVLLSSAFLILVSLMAFGEALVVWLRWPHLANPSFSHNVSITDFAMCPNGQWGASRINFYTKEHVLTSDVILCNLHEQNAFRLRIGRCRPQYVAVSPVSEELAITCLDRSIRIWSGFSDCEASLSEADGQLRPFARTSDHLEWLTFSPNGRLLAAVGSHFIHVWQWPGGELLHKRPRDERALPYLSFSGDSQHVLSPGAGGEVCLWDAYTGRTTAATFPGDSSVTNAALSPDAKCAALFSGRGLCVYRFADGEELWRDTRSASSAWRPIAYSLDGGFLATTASNCGARIIVFDAAGGQVARELGGHDAPITGLAFARDGRLYSSDVKGVIRSWDVAQQRELWDFYLLERVSINRSFLEDPGTSVP